MCMYIQESTHSPTMEQRNETTPTSSTPTPTPPAHGNYFLLQHKYFIILLF